mgnify:CR=1 FL=1
MNLLDTINNAVLSGTRALFSEATYTPASGDDPFTVHVILESIKKLTGGVAVADYTAALVPMRDVAEPQVDDTITLNGVTWQHRPAPGGASIREEAGPFWRLSCRNLSALTLGGRR